MRPLPSPRWVRRLALGALALALAFAAVRGAHRPTVDLAVFWRAGARFHAAAGLYDPPGTDMPYRYAPGVAALFAPLSRLPLAAGRAAWSVLSALLVLAVAWALDRQLGARAPLAAPLAWALLAQALAQEIGYGQVDLLVLALALGAFALDDRGREGAAGALLALAVALKVAPAVIFLDLAARRRWGAFLGAAGAALTLVAVTAVRYGGAGALREHVSWVASQSADVGSMIDSVRNQSLWAMARLAGVGRPLAALSCAALLALLLSAPRRRRVLLLAAVPLVSGYGWPQLFVLGVPLLAATLAEGGRAAWTAGAAAAAISLLGFDVSGPRVEAWAEGHRVLGLLFLVMVLAGRVAARAAPVRTAASPRAA